MPIAMLKKRNRDVRMKNINISVREMLKKGIFKSLHSLVGMHISVRRRRMI